MDSSNAALAVPENEVDPAAPAAVLRGTARGLEMLLNGRASADAIVEALEARLGEAPAFFRDSDVRISVEDGPLAGGCLTRLDELAQRFALRIVEISAARTVVAVPEAIPSKPNLAAGSSPNAFEDEAPTHSQIAQVIAQLEYPSARVEPITLDEVELVDEPAESFEEPTQTSVPRHLAATPEAMLAEDGPRLFVGPVRSGVILEHVGHLVVFGDVNPGAEVRATGSIVVLGRLRGTAHAGIGQELGFILALRLEPQQLRIGKRVARADSNAPAAEAEIAYVTGEQVVVESYTGRLPRNLATSL